MEMFCHKEKIRKIMALVSLCQSDFMNLRERESPGARLDDITDVNGEVTSDADDNTFYIFFYFSALA